MKRAPLSAPSESIAPANSRGRRSPFRAAPPSGVQRAAAFATRVAAHRHQLPAGGEFLDLHRGVLEFGLFGGGAVRGRSQCIDARQPLAGGRVQPHLHRGVRGQAQPQDAAIAAVGDEATHGVEAGRREQGGGGRLAGGLAHGVRKGRAVGAVQQGFFEGFEVQLLQQGDIGLGRIQPRQHIRQACFDGIHVEGGDGEGGHTPALM